jgi:uncharacterized protein YdhG (YjbR/CyaY superfamily)
MGGSTMTRQSSARTKPGGDFSAYARRFPMDIQERLRRVHSTIKQAVPECQETTGYNMPAFMLNDQIFIYVAAFKKHIGMYPPVRGPAALKRAVARYAGPKGNLQFLHSEPMPYGLIARVARSRAAEAEAKN